VIETPRDPTGQRKAVFLDRDGIVNVDHDYVHTIENFTFTDGLFELCRAAQRRGFVLVVITNQSGIARGYYTEEDFHALTTWMVEALASEHVDIAKVYYCPFHPEASVARYRMDSFDRKPNPGMLLRARDELQLDLGASLLIGDRLSDIEAGRRAGVGRLCLIPHTTAAAAAAAGEDPVLEDVLICKSLEEVNLRLFG
jgi:D-glycero-D-manno-heptose 1,7-bisphosphate phosphatase